MLHLIVSLGLFVATDKFLKQTFVAAGIKFPSALFGMFCIFSVLIILDSTVPSAATAVVNFFEPAFMFIQRWLPLFYVPSLVVLPLSVRDIPAASGIKIGLIVGSCMHLLFVSFYDNSSFGILLFLFIYYWYAKLIRISCIMCIFDVLMVMFIMLFSWRMASYTMCCWFHSYSCKKSRENNIDRC